MTYRLLVYDRVLPTDLMRQFDGDGQALMIYIFGDSAIDQAFQMGLQFATVWDDIGLDDKLGRFRIIVQGQSKTITFFQLAHTPKIVC